MSQRSWISLISFLLCFFSLVSYGQEEQCSLYGRIVDASMPDLGLELSSVVLRSGADSVLTTSRNYGNFTITKFRKGKALLRISRVGYLPFQDSVELSLDRNVITVALKPDIEQLTEARVSASIPVMTMRGDTLIYNTSALRTFDGDMAIELLKQLPGVEIKGKDIYVFGDKISGTYVNGVKIYGDTPIEAFNALKANEVTKISSYEELSARDRFRGMKNGKRERVLDIATRNPIVSAVDVQVLGSAGADLDEYKPGERRLRYGTGATANFYSEMLLLYSKFVTSNVERQTNGRSEINKSPGVMSSYNELSTANVGAQKFWKDRAFGNSLFFDYSFNKSYSKTESASRTSYMSDGRIQTDSVFSTSSSPSHSVSVEANLLRTPIRSISSVTRFSVSDSRSNSVSILGQKGLPEALRSELHDRTAQDSWRFAQILNWTDNESGKGFFPSLSGSLVVENDREDSWSVDTLSSSFLRRNLVSSPKGLRRNMSVLSSADISLLNEKSLTITLSPNIKINYNNGKYQKAGLNMLTEEIDPANTYDYTENTLGISHSLSIMAESQNFSANLHGSIDYARKTDDESLPESFRYARNFILPDMSFALSYRPLRLQVGYSMDSGSPDIFQLRERIDDSNPMYLKIGNSSLKSYSRHNLSIRRNFGRKNGRGAAHAIISASYMQREIISKLDYLSQDTDLMAAGYESFYPYMAAAGSSVISYANKSGGLNLSGQASISRRLPKMFLTLSYVPAISFSRSPQYYNGKVMFLNEFSPSLSLGATYRPNNRFNLNAKSNTRLELATIGGSNSVRGIEERLHVHGGWRISENWVTYWSHDMNIWRFSSGGTDRTWHVLNLAIGRGFLNKNLMVSISGHNLLNKGTDYSFAASGAATTETWNPAYGRFIMLNVHYRFNKASGTKFFGELFK